MTWLLSGVIYIIGNRIEFIADRGTQLSRCSDYRDRYETGNECIFNGGYPRFIPPQFLQSLNHLFHLLSFKADCNLLFYFYSSMQRFIYQKKSPDLLKERSGDPFLSSVLYTLTPTTKVKIQKLFREGLPASGSSYLPRLPIH